MRATRSSPPQGDPDYWASVGVTSQQAAASSLSAFQQSSLVNAEQWFGQEAVSGYKGYVQHVTGLNVGRAPDKQIAPMSPSAWAQLPGQAQYRARSGVPRSAVPDDPSTLLPQFASHGVFDTGAAMLTPMEALEHSFIGRTTAGGVSRYLTTAQEGKELKRTQLLGKHPRVAFHGPGVSAPFPEALPPGVASIKRDPVQTMTFAVTLGEVGTSGQAYYDPQRVHGATRPIVKTAWEQVGAPLPTVQEARGRIGETWARGTMFQAAPGHTGWKDPWHASRLQDVQPVTRMREGQEQAGLQYLFEGNVAMHRAAIKSGAFKHVMTKAPWVSDIREVGGQPGGLGIDVQVGMKDIQGYAYNLYRQFDPQTLQRELGLTALPPSHQELGEIPLQKFMGPGGFLEQRTKMLDIPQAIHRDSIKEILARGVVHVGGQQITDISQLTPRSGGQVYDVDIRQPALVGKLAVVGMEEYGQGPPFLNYAELQRLKQKGAQPEYYKELMARPGVQRSRAAYRGAYEAFLATKGVSTDPAHTQALRAGVEHETMTYSRAQSIIGRTERELREGMGVGPEAELPRGAANRALMEALGSGKYGTRWSGHIGYEAGKQRAVSVGAERVGYFGAAGTLEREDVSGLVQSEAEMFRSYASGGIGMGKAIGRYERAISKVGGGKQVSRRLAGATLSEGSGDVVKGHYALGAQEFYHPKMAAGTSAMIFGSPATSSAYTMTGRAISAENAIGLGLDPSHPWISKQHIQRAARDTDADLMAIVPFSGLEVDEEGTPRDKYGNAVTSLDDLYEAERREIALGAGSLTGEYAQGMTKDEFIEKVRGTPIQRQTRGQTAGRMQEQAVLQSQVGRFFNIGQLSGSQTISSVIYSKAQRPAEQTAGAMMAIRATTMNWDTGAGRDPLTGQPIQSLGERGRKGPQWQLTRMVEAMTHPRFFAEEMTAKDKAAWVKEASASLAISDDPRHRAAIESAFGRALASPTSEPAREGVVRAALGGGAISNWLLKSDIGSLAIATSGARAVTRAGDVKRWGKARDPVEFMMEAGGFNRAEAEAVIAKIPESKRAVTAFAHHEGRDIREQAAALKGLGLLGVDIKPAAATPAPVAAGVGAGAPPRKPPAAAVPAGAMPEGDDELMRQLGGYTAKGGGAAYGPGSRIDVAIGGAVARALHGPAGRSTETSSRWRSKKELAPMTEEYGESIKTLSQNVQQFSSAVKDATDPTAALGKNAGKARTMLDRWITEIKGLQGYAGSDDPSVQATRSALQTQLPMLQARSAQLRRGMERGQMGEWFGGAGGPPPDLSYGRMPQEQPTGWGRATRGVQKMLGGWGMFYLSRMANLGTRTMREGMTQYFAEEQALHGAMYGAGLAGAPAGASADIMAYQAQMAQMRSGIGRTAWNTWGPAISGIGGMGGQGGGIAGLATTVGLPALTVGATAGYMANAFGLGSFGAVGLGVGSLAGAVGLGSWVAGQSRDVGGMALGRMDLNAAGYDPGSVARNIGPLAGTGAGLVAQDIMGLDAYKWVRGSWADQNVFRPLSEQLSASVALQSAAAPVAAGGLAGLQGLTQEQQRVAIQQYSQTQMSGLLTLEQKNALLGGVLPYLGNQAMPAGLMGGLEEAALGGGDPFALARAGMAVSGTSVLENPRYHIAALQQATQVAPWRQGPLAERAASLSRFGPWMRGTGQMISQAGGGLYVGDTSNWVDVSRWGEDRFGFLGQIVGTRQQEYAQGYYGGASIGQSARQLEQMSSAQMLQYTSQDALASQMIAGQIGGLRSQAVQFGVEPMAAINAMGNLGTADQRHQMQLMLQRNPLLWAEMTEQDMGGLASQFGLSPSVTTTGVNRGISRSTVGQWGLQRQQHALQQAGMFGGMGFTGSFAFQQAGLTAGREYQQATTGLGWGYQQQQWGFRDPNVAGSQLDLQRRGMELGWEQQQYRMDTGQQRAGQQYQWAQEDWSYQENRAQLGFGWQMEDFDEAIRFSTGRQRMLLERKRGRAVISEAMRGEHADDQLERLQERRQWQEEDHEKERKWFEERKGLQQEQYDLAVAQFEAQKDYQTELHELQVAHATFQFDQQQAQLEEAKKMAKEQDKLWEAGHKLAIEAARHNAEWQEFYDRKFPKWFDGFSGDFEDLFTEDLPDMFDQFIRTVRKVVGAVGGGKPGAPIGDKVPDGDGGGGDEGDVCGVDGKGPPTKDGVPGEIVHCGPNIWIWNGRDWQKGTTHGSTTISTPGRPASRSSVALRSSDGTGSPTYEQLERLIAAVNALQASGKLQINVTSQEIMAGVEAGLSLADQAWAH